MLKPTIRKASNYKWAVSITMPNGKEITLWYTSLNDACDAAKKLVTLQVKEANDFINQRLIRRNNEQTRYHQFCTGR